jgi:hypothetical protein
MPFSRRREPLVPKLDGLLLGTVRRTGILYQWVGGTRRNWCGQGHSALSSNKRKCGDGGGFEEVVVKTKNRY